MVKKILYCAFCLFFGFIVFYVCWQSSCSKAVVNRSNEALGVLEDDTDDDFTFFLKFADYAKTNESYFYTYEEDRNTTKIKAFEIFANDVTINEETNEKADRSGYMFIIYNLNLDVVELDSSSSSDDSETEKKSTRILFYGDNGKSFEIEFSTEGMDKTNANMLTLSTDYIVSHLNGDATKITGIKIYDPADFVAYSDTSVNIPLVQYNEESYWKALKESNVAITGFTPKEYRNAVSFAFPEMTSAFVITLVVLFLLTGVGLFIFWPKRSHVPDEEFTDRFTFSPDEDKEKTAIERVARDKKEKDDRLNKYKNVRANSENEVIEASEVVENNEESNEEIIEDNTSEQTTENAEEKENQE